MRHADLRLLCAFLHRVAKKQVSASSGVILLAKSVCGTYGHRDVIPLRVASADYPCVFLCQNRENRLIDFTVFAEEPKEALPRSA